MRTGFLLLCAALLAAVIDAPAQHLSLATQRSSPEDLEITGALPGVAPGSSRFLRYADLSLLPQVSYTVRDDDNFAAPARLSGVSLDELLRALGIGVNNLLIAARCSDGYEGHYTAQYRAAHHPFLVLRIGGKDPVHWPPGSDGEKYGPWLISHPSFPPYRNPARDDHPQIPFAVVRLQFFNQDAALRALRPPGPLPPSSPAMLGSRLAFQNCLRCHRKDMIGGTKSPYAWSQLARIAQGNPTGFGRWVIRPNAVNPEALMPANPEYGSTAIAALTAYFRSFAPAAKP